jgi:hypothetical protein
LKLFTIFLKTSPQKLVWVVVVGCVVLNLTLVLRVGPNYGFGLTNLLVDNFIITTLLLNEIYIHCILSS